MKIDNTVTIEISSEDIKELIIASLEKAGYEAIEIDFDIKNDRWTEGQGVMEYDYETLIFMGATVKARNKSR